MPQITQSLLKVISLQFPQGIFYQETSQKVIALTLDDVPTPHDPNDAAIHRLLTLLTSAQVKATFFVITRHLTQGTEILKTMIQEGHEVANHGVFDHSHARLSPSKFQKEIQQAHDTIYQATQTPIRWFRPGQGFYNQAMIETLNKMSGYHPKFALGSMIPLDTYKGFNHPSFTLKYLQPFIFSGSILILHGGTIERTENTINVLKSLLPSLQEKGYRIVTLSDLIPSVNV